MSDTPRTDAAREHVQNAFNDWVRHKKEATHFVVSASEMERLERDAKDRADYAIAFCKERDELKARIRRLEAAADEMMACISVACHQAIVDYHVQQLQKAKEAKP